MKWITLISAFLLLGCRNGNHERVDSPTSGSIKIAVDDSLRPWIEAEVNAFTSIYPKASISTVYVSELEAVNLLLADSVTLAVVTRDLTTAEEAIIESQKISAQHAVVAREGIAIIVHRSSTDTLWSISRLESLLHGSTDTHQTKVDGQLQIVFDHKSSGIVRYIRDSLLNGTAPSNSYAVENNESVIDYVSSNNQAVGFIGASWISDGDDSATNQFRSTIRVVALEHAGEYNKPYQAYIALGTYPLIRDVVICSREARSGLGTGFMSFVAGDKGQRIALKAGLVPATMPIRLVEINHEPL